jgi:hypothetical protein
MADIGAHHSCWLLLQALFMIARVLTANSTTTLRTIAKGVFIVTSLLRVSTGQVSVLQNEPMVNVGLLPERTRPLPLE